MDTARFVRAILERNRRPDAQLEDLVIHYTCHDSIGRLDPSDELVSWTATLELPFYDKDGGATRTAGRRDGGTAGRRDGGTAEPVVIATARYNRLASAAPGSTLASDTTEMASSSAIPLLANSTARSTN